jgi:hypothetical protein
MEPDSEFSSRQDYIIEALEHQSPRLAGMYRSVLNLLRSKPEVGCEVARVSMICHCMRELMTNLLAGAEGFIERIDPSSVSLASRLPKLLAKHSDLNLGADQDIVPVPKAVARHFDALVKARVQEEGRNQHNAAALITGGSDPKHPATKQWGDAYSFFLRWAHLDQHNERNGALASDQEILVFIRVVEDVIEVRRAAFFDNMHTVSDLLAIANAPSGGEELWRNTRYRRKRW